MGVQLFYRYRKFEGDRIRLSYDELSRRLVMDTVRTVSV